MVRSIQYMRGLACILVVMFHFTLSLPKGSSLYNLLYPIFFNGKIGVDLFFIISGFVISMATESDGSLRSFVIKRCFRIYPVYFIITISIYFISKDFTFNDLVRSFFFSQLDYTSAAPQFGYSIIDVGWTLTYEVIFYLVFLVSMMISHKNRLIITSSLLIAFPVFLQLYCNNSFNISGYAYSKFESIKFPLIPLSSSMMLEFIIGIFIFVIYKKSFYWNRRYNFIIFLFSLISSTISIYYYFSGEITWHGADAYGLLCLPVVILFIFFERLFALPKISSIDFIASISFSLYLTHVSIGKIFSNFLIPYINNSLPSLVLLLAIKIAVSIVISWLTFKYIEKFFMKLGRSFLI